MRNFAFPGYAKHVWTRSAFRATHPLRRGQKGFHRLATGGYGPWVRIVCCQVVARHPLRRGSKGLHRLATGGYGPSEDPNRRLPSRCKAPVAARTLAFRMDRWRERSLKHQRCRPKECQRREKGGLQLIEAPRKPQPNADSQTSPVPTATPNRC